MKTLFTALVISIGLLTACDKPTTDEVTPSPPMIINEAHEATVDALAIVDQLIENKKASVDALAEKLADTGD